MNRKTKIFIITFFSIILIPVIVISIILGYNDKKLNDKINKSKSTRILMLNNIDNPIAFEELCNIESSKEYKIEDDDLGYKNEQDKKDFTVTYTNTSFFGSNCIKEYFFVDEKLKRCIYTIDSSQWMPKNIYEEIVNINGEPDIHNSDDESFYLEVNEWYGKNGIIILNKLNNDTIEIIFELTNEEIK
jgi:hypothetical protein|nr:MAG TPA: hypothetical protein [Caudoviricetes sp.]